MSISISNQDLVENRLLEHFQPRAITYVIGAKNGAVLVSLENRKNISFAGKALKDLSKDIDIKIYAKGDSVMAAPHL